MKSLKSVLALVILGGFAATCEAEYVVNWTGIVRDVKIITSEAPAPLGLGDGWVTKTIEVDIEEPAGSGPRRESYDSFNGGFVSEAEFWNPEDEQAVEFPRAFDRVNEKWYSFISGTEFVLPAPNQGSIDDVDKSLGGEASGGQISTGGAIWVRPSEAGINDPIPTPTGRFDFAKLIIPKDETFATVGFEAPPGEAINPIVGGSVKFWKNGVNVGSISIVPEPASGALAVFGAILATLVFWARRRV